jgi:hypothetical protein
MLNCYKIFIFYTNKFGFTVPGWVVAGWGNEANTWRAPGERQQQEARCPESNVLLLMEDTIG